MKEAGNEENVLSAQKARPKQMPASTALHVQATAPLNDQNDGALEPEPGDIGGSNFQTCLGSGREEPCEYEPELGEDQRSNEPNPSQISPVRDRSAQSTPSAQQNPSHFNSKTTSRRTGTFLRVDASGNAVGNSNQASHNTSIQHTYGEEGESLRSAVSHLEGAGDGRIGPPESNQQSRKHASLLPVESENVDAYASELNWNPASFERKRATVHFNINETTEVANTERRRTYEEPEEVKLRGDLDSSSLLSTSSKRQKMVALKQRLHGIPYRSAIERLAELQDLGWTRSPFEMVECVADISKHIEETITRFWEGISVIDPDKLVIDGDNILMLYLHIVLSAKIPSIFSYMKMMDEFSTPYVRSISRFGYCLSTLEIALERIISYSLTELIKQQREHSMQDRSEVYNRNMRESFLQIRERAASLRVATDEVSPQPATSQVKGATQRKTSSAVQRSAAPPKGWEGLRGTKHAKGLETEMTEELLGLESNPFHHRPFGLTRYSRQRFVTQRFDETMSSRSKSARHFLPQFRGQTLPAGYHPSQAGRAPSRTTVRALLPPSRPTAPEGLMNSSHTVHEHHGHPQFEQAFHEQVNAVTGASSLQDVFNFGAGHTNHL